MHIEERRSVGVCPQPKALFAFPDVLGRRGSRAAGRSASRRMPAPKPIRVVILSSPPSAASETHPALQDSDHAEGLSATGGRLALDHVRVTPRHGAPSMARTLPRSRAYRAFQDARAHGCARASLQGRTRGGPGKHDRHVIAGPREAAVPLRREAAAHRPDVTAPKNVCSSRATSSGTSHSRT